MQTSLGGNSRTAIICCISPSLQFVEESITTLNFADRARVVYNSVRVNEEDGTQMVPAEHVRDLLRMWEEERRAAEEFERGLLQRFELRQCAIARQCAADANAHALLFSKMDEIACASMAAPRQQALQARDAVKETTKKIQDLEAQSACLKELARGREELRQRAAGAAAEDALQRAQQRVRSLQEQCAAQREEVRHARQERGLQARELKERRVESKALNLSCEQQRMVVERLSALQAGLKTSGYASWRAKQADSCGVAAAATADSMPPTARVAGESADAAPPAQRTGSKRPRRSVAHRPSSRSPREAL